MTSTNNQINRIDGSWARDYSWDSLGNLSGKTGSEGSWSHAHDAFNRLAEPAPANRTVG